MVERNSEKYHVNNSNTLRYKESAVPYLYPPTPLPPPGLRKTCTFPKCCRCTVAYFVYWRYKNKLYLISLRIVGYSNKLY